jgi:hypothetical protein
LGSRRRGPEAQAVNPIKVNEEIYLVSVRVARSETPVSTYHPSIVIGCAIANRTLLAIFINRKKFDIKAIASCTALMASNL